MEKKEQNSQKKMLTFLYTASTFLVLVILVIGVTMMNNYDRMTNMETAIHQISQTLDQESTEQNQDTLEQQATEENQEALANQEAAGIAAEELGDARSNEDAAEAAGDDGEGTADEIAAENTEEEIDYIVEKTKEVVAYLRSISPVWSRISDGRSGKYIFWRKCDRTTEL